MTHFHDCSYPTITQEVEHDYNRYWTHVITKLIPRWLTTCCLRDCKMWTLWV